MRVFMRSMGILGIATITAVGGCGGGDDDEGTPLSELPQKLATTLCATWEECFGPSFDLFFRGTDCVEQATRDVENGEFALIQRAVDAGDVRYDGSQVDACIRAVQSKGCDIFVNRIVSVCEGVISGTVESGGDCTLDAECESGLFCMAGSSCPGTCTALLAAGQSCMDDDECADGLLCSDETNRCIEPAREGEACEGGSEPPCLPNLGCQGASDTAPGTCVGLDEIYVASAGASCDLFAGRLCQEGQTCAVLSVTADQQFEMQCEPPVTGGACRIAAPEQCPTGQFCELPVASVEGTCTALPEEGQSCGRRSPSDAPELCAPEHACVAGTCRALRELGAPCDTDDQCYSGVCRDGGCAPSRCADAP